MNKHDRIARGAHLLASLLLAAGLAACGERLSENQAKTSTTPASSQPSPSAVVVGQAPADPTGDPPGTTPAASNTTEVTQKEESRGKPDEGDNHSHSTLAPVTPQKADGVNITGGDGEKTR